jgi:amidase
VDRRDAARDSVFVDQRKEAVMTVKPPTREDVERAAATIGLTLENGDADSYLSLLGAWFAVYAAVEDMPATMPTPTGAREGGRRPHASENPLNAWYYKTDIRSDREGKLSGKLVVLKDNIMLAGVPMMNGSSVLEGYVPDVDATVVARVLDAGGTIAGKAHCECLCLSGGSHTCAAGPVHNPRRHGYSAGGSSSGCAALVAAGEVDMAIGGDQGGSIRMPSAFCGTYGMKPTYGLVPYTGILPIEITIDHTGPITASVYDNALLLEAIAGDDGYDPRQRALVVEPYSDALSTDVTGLRIATVREGFDVVTPDCEVGAKVRAAAERFARLGATVEEVSIPAHLESGAIIVPMLVEGVVSTMLAGEGLGSGRSDLYVPSLMEFLHERRGRIDEQSETVKLAALAGAWIRERHGLRFYGKAVNLTRALRAAYDVALADYDLLLMPTVPTTATPLPGPGASREEILWRAFEPGVNTQGFNLTHHPAMSVPCGMSDGLPVGMMLVGRHFAESTIYRAAHAFEQHEDWTAL